MAKLVLGSQSREVMRHARNRTADNEGRLVWDPGVEWTGGGLASTSRDLALWGHHLFAGEVMEAPYLDRLLDGVPVSPETTAVLYGAGADHDS